MLSRQIYTSTYCNIESTDIDRILNIDNNKFTGANHVSKVLRHQRVPHGYEVEHQVKDLTRKPMPINISETSETSETSSHKIQRFPTSPQNTDNHESEVTKVAEPIPIVQHTNYLSPELFDPTIVNSPPSEFINQLNNRLEVYFPSV